MDNQSQIKKKIMFSKGDDFYFLTYNILLILYSLDCQCNRRTFKDHRKLAFLIDFISNRNLAKTINKNDTFLNDVDRELFINAYSNGMLRLNQIIRLLFTLESQGIISLSREPGTDTVNVCLKKDKITSGFFDKDLFKLELSNMSLITSSVHRISVLTLENLLTRLFYNHGIKKWAK